MIVLAIVLLVWVCYNLFVERQPQFRTTGGGILFVIGLLGVGGKWVFDGWSAMQGQSRPRKRKKRRRPVADDE